jgi:hypothetical protein
VLGSLNHNAYDRVQLAHTIKKVKQFWQSNMIAGLPLQILKPFPMDS